MKNTHEKGFTLYEIIAAMAIGSLLLAAGAELASQRTQDIKDQNTAQYQTMFNSAAVRYVQSIASTITPANTAANPRVVTFNDIQSAGFIPANYATATTNPYNQTPCVFVSVDGARPNEINALVVTEGGQNIPTGRVPNIATLIGASGGYILPTAPTTATGAYAKWTQPIPNRNCSGTRAAGNHLASQLYFDNGNLVQNFLYRSEVPGRPEANTMTTPLIMAATVTATDACATLGAIATDAQGNVMSCAGAPPEWKQAGGSQFWKDPVATKADLDAILCDATNLGETRVVNTPTVGVGPRAYSCNGATWAALSLDDDGNFTVAGTLTANRLAGNLEVVSTGVAGAACSPNGRIARDASGQLLQCSGNVWTVAGRVIVSGNSSIMNLPLGANYTVQVTGSYFTCVDVATALRLDGVSQKVYFGAGGDTEGCDQNTVNALIPVVGGGLHTFSFSQGAYQDFNWVAYKN